jgi:nitrite reductase (NO-forming)
MHKALIPLIGALALVLAACNGDGGDSPAPGEAAQPATGEDDSVEIDVVAGDIFYQPEGVEIPAGTTLVVHLNNEGALEHDFTTEDGQGTSVLQAGESETAEVGPFEESTTAFCTVPGHREAGMEFEITVTG